MGIEIEGDMLNNALSTNASETLELLNLYFYIYIFVALIGLYLINKKILVTQKSLPMKHYFILMLTLFLLVFGLFKLNREALDEFIKHDTPKIVPTFIFPAISDYIIMLDRKVKIDKKSISREFKLKEDFNDTIVIFVLGESARGDRFELNGYPKSTTPELLKQKNIVSFKNVTSCDTSTLNSIPCLMMRVKHSAYNQEIKESSFVEIFKDLGYQTYWFSRNSNQKRVDTFCQESQDCQYLYDLEYDNDLLVNLKSVINKDGNIFVLLHTMGSHINYNIRVPKRYRKFQPLCESGVSNCTKEELDNSYDNSIYYTNIFLSKIIDTLSNKNAILIYTSDHGESLGEDSYGLMKHFGHSTPYRVAPKEQTDVPFILWFSDKYLENHKSLNLEKMRKLENISHDNIFYSTLGCADISSQEDKNINKLNVCNPE